LIYDHKCKQCGTEKEAVNSVAERHTNAPACCGEPMPIIIKTAPMGYMGRTIDYMCPVTNQHISSKAQRRDVMARNGLAPAHELMQTKEQRNKAEQRVNDLKKAAYGPSEIMRQVNEWGRSQTA